MRPASGLTLEALNHLGHPHSRLLIVLNDNEMSISPSVGGLSTRLESAVGCPAPTRGRSRSPPARCPVCRSSGGRLYDVLRLGQGGLQAIVGAVAFFEDMGITYIGVLDGHDRADLEQAFERAFHIDRRSSSTSRP